MSSRTFKDQYELGEELGKGAFSAVFKATRKSSNERFAVKVLDKSKLEPKDIESVDMEIRVLSTIDHPNVLKLIEFFEEGNLVYIVTELCEGGELFDRIVERNYYTEGDAQLVVKALASALQHCHEKKIVHRDLKPENILLLTTDPDSPLKIADFGFSRQLESEEELTTALGTPNYIAPEVLKQHPYDSAVDCWSLGVIIFILLCGYPPFYADTNPQMFLKIKQGKFSFDSPYWDNISEEAKDLISKLLRVNPLDRLDINGVLSHPWLKKSLEQRDITPALHELREMMAKRRLKRGIGAVIAMNKMKSVMRSTKSPLG